jgi:hypothetical protein
MNSIDKLEKPGCRHVANHKPQTTSHKPQAMRGEMNNTDRSMRHLSVLFPFQALLLLLLLLLFGFRDGY